MPLSLLAGDDAAVAAWTALIERYGPVETRSPKESASSRKIRRGSDVERAQRSVSVDGSILRAARLARNWEPDDLARATGLSKRTIEDAEAGWPKDRKTIRKIADKLRLDYDSLVSGNALDQKHLLRVQVVLQCDIREVQNTPHLTSFLELLMRLVPDSDAITLKAIGAGSVLLTLELSEENATALLLMFPEFHEHARAAIADTPAGEAYFRGQHHPDAEKIAGLLYLVEAVRELRVQTREYHEPPAPEPGEAPPDTGTGNPPSANTSPGESPLPAPVDEFASYLDHLRDVASGEEGMSKLDTLRDETELLPPSPLREARLRAIGLRQAEIFGEWNDHGRNQPK